MPFEPLVVVDIERTHADVVTELGRAGTSTVHESYRRRGILTGITSAVPGRVMSGTAVTALCYPGDNLMLQAAIEVAQPGDVLVVAVTAPSLHGMLGDLLATACQTRGLAGVVLDSGVRDVSELRRMGFPVFSRAITSVGTTKAGLGYVNVPVSCGGVVVYPGDAIVGDDDGVVAVERDAALEVARRAREREVVERDVRTAFLDGAVALGPGEMRAALEAVGLPPNAGDIQGYH